MNKRELRQRIMFLTHVEGWDNDPAIVKEVRGYSKALTKDEPNIRGRPVPARVVYPDGTTVEAVHIRALAKKIGVNEGTIRAYIGKNRTDSKGRYYEKVSN